MISFFFSIFFLPQDPSHEGFTATVDWKHNFNHNRKWFVKRWLTKKYDAEAKKG